jgi:hypothetical protein
MTRADRSQRSDPNQPPRGHHRRAIIPLVAIALALLLGGCPGSAGDAIEAVEVSPAAATLVIDQTLQLEVDVAIRSGRPSTTVAWSSSDPAVASVENGLVRAQAPGTATITATSTFDPSRLGTSTIDVTVGPPLDLACEEEPAVAGPTLICRAAEGAVVVRIPWQGVAVAVESRPLTGLFGLPAGNDFTPTAALPIAKLAVRNAASAAPITTFDPPLWLQVSYSAPTFAAADPQVNRGSLGLGVWDEGLAGWIVLGHGVYHEGFWLADPLAETGMTLVPDPTSEPAQPRFQLTGGPTGGAATAVLSGTLVEFPVAWGGMPADPEHALVAFDGPCQEVALPVGPALSCVSSAAGMTLQVPFQGDGTVRPRVITLPMNRRSTFPDEPPVQLQGGNTPPNLVRRLMNFLVVDDDDPTTVLTSFDPPLEFEIEYTAADKDPSVNEFLVVKYWEEYLETWVILGMGSTSDCNLTYAPNGNDIPECLWGFPVEAGVTDDPRFMYEGFFLTNPDGNGGIAKFTYDRWGDRLVAFGR